MEVIQCLMCGDSCGTGYCLSCEDTANDMGIDLESVWF